MSKERQGIKPAGRCAVSDVWLLDPDITYLNHGSFGSCPRPVIEFQRELKTTLVLVTHSIDIAQIADRMIVLQDGRITPEHNNGKELFA